MIKIEPYFDDAPPELWREVSKKRSKSKFNPQGHSKLELALKQANSHEFDVEIYGSKSVKQRLKQVFKQKCAFCESNITRGAHLDIEHFRAKTHYYWLGYEWSNFLLACHICNRDYKKTKFPLLHEANRVISPPKNAQGALDRAACDIRQLNLMEQPLLLHPALDDPKEHLQFLPNGAVQGITQKGRESIDAYGLNRENLEKYRKKIVQDIRQEICEEYLHKTQLSDNELITEVRKAINRLQRCIQEAGEYVGLAQTILEQFETFIIDNEDLDIIMPDKDRLKVIAQMLLS
jgi:uncharacterized protein (TIGR02646 family)